MQSCTTELRVTAAVQRVPCHWRMALITSSHAARLIPGSHGWSLVLLCRSLCGGGGDGLQAKAIAMPSIAEADLDWRAASAGKRITATEPWKAPPEPIET